MRTLSYPLISNMLLALALTVASVRAQDVATPQRIDLANGHSVFFTPLTVVKGSPGESQDVVINRAARAIDEFTQATQMEACGDITIGANDVLRIVVGTIHAHIGCVTISLQKGYHSTGMSIHSHPTRRTFIVNVADVASNSVADSVFQSLNVGRSMTAGIHGQTFSATDLRESMSYLVTNGHLLYQVHGKIYDRGVVISLSVGSGENAVSAR